jgi:hypothetical protein
MSKKEKTMTTILILNAISSLAAGAGIAGVLAWRSRRARETTRVRPVYVATRR